VLGSKEVDRMRRWMACSRQGKLLLNASVTGVFEAKKKGAHTLQTFNHARQTAVFEMHVNMESFCTATEWKAHQTEVALRLELKKAEAALKEAVQKHDEGVQKHDQEMSTATNRVKAAQVQMRRCRKESSEVEQQLAAFREAFVRPKDAPDDYDDSDGKVRWC
jgi:chromosome segregation ATPase